MAIIPEGLQQRETVIVLYLCELNAILSSKCEHIILIDDAREFNGSNDYPSIQIFDSVIREKGYFNSKISLEDDIIRIELKL